MKFDYGILVAIVGALIFYTRLTMVQRRASRQQEEPGEAPRRASLIRNWFFLALGLVLVCAGALFAATSFSPLLKTYWWVPLTLGFITLVFAV